MTGGESAGELRVGFITCRFPPMTSSGTFRVEAMLANFPRLGIQPIVVTIPDEWVRAQTSTLEGEVDAEPMVLRPRTGSDRIVRWLGRIPIVRWIAREILIPDNLSLWAHGATVAAADHLASVDIVYATSPPFSAMILADRVAARLGVPLVQEFRDPPSFNRRLRGRTRLTRWRMERFEARYLSRADATIAVTAGTRRELLRLHPQLDPATMHVVTNGYPNIVPDPNLATRDQDRFTVAYVGSFQGSERAGSVRRFTPEIILPALRALPGKPELRVVGPVTAAQRASLEAAGGTTVTMLGRVPRRQAIAELAAADVCLAIAEDDPWWIGRKIFEYMAFAKRILAVVPPGDTADILAQSSKALVAGMGEEGALHRALVSLHEEWRTGAAEAPAGENVPSDETCAEEVAAVLRAVASN